MLTGDPFKQKKKKRKKHASLVNHVSSFDHSEADTTLLSCLPFFLWQKGPRWNK